MEILNANFEDLNYIGIHSDNFNLSQEDKSFLGSRLNDLKEIVPAYASILFNISHENRSYEASLCVNAYNVKFHATSKGATIYELYDAIEKEVLKQVELWKKERRVTAPI